MKLLPIYFIVFISLSLSIGKEKSVYQANYLKGKVATLEETNYFVNELGEKSKILMSTSIYKFDSVGVLTEETFASANGINFSRKIYANDAKGNILQCEVFAKHGKLEKKHIFKYDKKGNCTLKYLLKADGKTVAEKLISKFDKNGNEIEFSKCGEDTLKILNKAIYKYDNKNQKIETIIYKGDLKTISAREKYKYDKAGNIIEYTGLNNKGLLHKKIENKFDSNNNLIESKTYKGDGTSITLWVKYSFDDNHNTTEMTYLKADGTIEEKNIYEFTYDKQGNWLSQKRKTNDGLNGIIERKLTYY